MSMRERDKVERKEKKIKRNHSKIIQRVESTFVPRLPADEKKVSGTPRIEETVSKADGTSRKVKKARKNYKDPSSSSLEHVHLEKLEVEPPSVSTRKKAIVSGTQRSSHKVDKSCKSDKDPSSSSPGHGLDLKELEVEPPPFIGKVKKDHTSWDGEHGLVQNEVDPLSLASKVKKSRKSRKERISWSVDHELVDKDGKLETPSLSRDVITQHNSLGKVKSKKDRKNNKDHILRNAEDISMDKKEQDKLGKVYQFSFSENDLCTKGKMKKSGKSKKKYHLSSEKDSGNKGRKIEPLEVYQISSGEEDSSTGMKKWLKEYHENIPGIKVLQQRIDDFITEYEAQEEEARKKREAEAAEGGWTVVVHHKGGKKTTDPDSGVAVGSVNQTAVLEKLAQKKGKDVGLNFYRFQRREAQRNEIMRLQSKFEEDKKRIQQLRAARKFKPY